MGKSHDLAVLARKTDRLDVVADSEGALSHRNLIINGAMQVAQRGDTASNVTTNGVKTVDRFNVEGGSYDAFDLAVSTGPDGFSRALKVSRNTAVAAASGAEYMLVSQVIEAQNLQHLAYGTSNAKKITISFWVKSTATGTYSLNLYANDTGSARTATKNYTIDAANTWEYKTVTFDGDPDGQINNDNGHGIWVQWFLRAGGNYKGTQSPTWSAHTTAQYADGHTADFMSSANGSWELTGVQVEVGDEATDFEHRPYGDELARCERYFQQWIGDGTTPYIAVGRNHTSTLAIFVMNYRTEMRARPTLSFNGITTYDGGSRVVSAVLANGNSKTSTGFNCTVSGAPVPRETTLYLNNATTSYFRLDAEL